MKKVLFFLLFIILLFAGVAYLSHLKKEKAADDNPYGKSALNAATVDQLDDPNYQNIIQPKDLKDNIEAKKDVTVYFYSPTCGYCQKTTPIVNPVAKDLGIDLVQYNLLEYEQGWDDYRIESTPTIIQFKDGKETNRIVGYQKGEAFKQWFEDNTLK
ncbi:thioredoxin family protein [Niallia sp. 03091]|uniref:thioredoxin family protein n=1 Tax=Niallia sp. 03091 TaxID=3458059 RepID=UPI0040444F87